MANPNFGRAFREILELIEAIGGTLAVGEKLNAWKQNLQDLNPNERSELENIIQTYNLTASLSGCTTEFQAIKEITNSLTEVDPEIRAKVASAIDRVLTLD